MVIKNVLLNQRKTFVVVDGLEENPKCISSYHKYFIAFRLAGSYIFFILTNLYFDETIIFKHKKRS